MDDSGTIWNSGHVNAVLPMGTATLVAADTGGVWSATESGVGLPLTDWEAPDLLALVGGPDGANHVYAAGGIGVALSAPEVVVTTSPDQLHAFATGHDHALWHYVRTAGVWSKPESLGPDVVGPPAVCSWGGSRLDVFVIGTDGALYHKAWDGTAWTPDWERLGGVCVGQPSVCSWGLNRLDIFVIGTDGALYHKWWDGANWGPSRDGYEPMGGSLVFSPLAIATGPNHLDVFCVQRGDHQLLHKRYDGGWIPSVTGYDSLGPVANVPAATSWGSNTIQLCAVQPDGSLGFKSWTGTSWSPSTTGWTALGALPDKLISAPSVTSWGANRLDVISVDATGTVQHKWLDGTAWGPSATGWEALGAWSASHANIISPGANRLDIVIAGGDGLLYWKSYAGSWDPWVGGWTALLRPIIGALHETDVTAGWPLLSWREVTIPQEAGRPGAIAVFPTRRRIVLACDSGLWWSTIPASSARGVGYSWLRIGGVPEATWSGLAVTGDDTFVAAISGSNVGTGAYGLWTGTFGPSGPTMQRSNISGADPRWMARTSVASCDNTRRTVYAVASDVWWDHGYTDAVDAVCWGSNRIDVFARGANSECQHLAWNGSAWAWDALGGVLLGTPKVVSWGTSRLDVFCVGTNRRPEPAAHVVVVGSVETPERGRPNRARRSAWVSKRSTTP
jgi:hypothetical protein